jgi:hypothetical protein
MSIREPKNSNTTLLYITRGNLDGPEEVMIFDLSQVSSSPECCKTVQPTSFTSSYREISSRIVKYIVIFSLENSMAIDIHALISVPWTSAPKRPRYYTETRRNIAWTAKTVELPFNPPEAKITAILAPEYLIVEHEMPEEPVLFFYGKENTTGYSVYLFSTTSVTGRDIFKNINQPPPTKSYLGLVIDYPDNMEQHAFALGKSIDGRLYIQMFNHEQSPTKGLRMVKPSVAEKQKRNVEDISYNCTILTQLCQATNPPTQGAYCPTNTVFCSNLAYPPVQCPLGLTCYEKDGQLNCCDHCPYAFCF